MLFGAVALLLPSTSVISKQGSENKASIYQVIDRKWSVTHYSSDKKTFNWDSEIIIKRLHVSLLCQDPPEKQNKSDFEPCSYPYSGKCRSNISNCELLTLWLNLIKVWTSWCYVQKLVLLERHHRTKRAVLKGNSLLSKLSPSTALGAPVLRININIF